MATQRTLSAAEAAAELGVRAPTLYAYVSRGLIRSERAGTGERGRRYLAEDIAQLKARKRERHSPARAVRQALNWGAPVMDTSLTAISDGHLLYRGHNAVTLANTASAEQVAALFWLNDIPMSEPLFAGRFVLSAQCRRVLGKLDGLTAVQRMQAVLPVAAAEDFAAYDLDPTAIARTGARIVRLLTAIAAQTTAIGAPVSVALQRRWMPYQPETAALIDAALVLCADHELNVSTFTARCVASAGATPYNAVLAGLAALQGIRHGGHTERIEALWHELGSRPARGVRQVLASYLRRGEPIPGFGHMLYAQGDPRAAELIRLMGQTFPKSPVMTQCDRLVKEAAQLIDQGPTIDVALVVLARLLNLPEDGALMLFSIGRTIGWIGHAIEQVHTGQMIRPRARYVGEVPLTTSRPSSI